jgi:5S rRNA maturation endonuclease (ribonuclease M5)
MTDLIELLSKRGIEHKKTNNPAEILLYCTSGEHKDKSPSLSFNVEKNIFNCWSCGFRGGINKYLASIGEMPIIDIDSKQPYKIKKLKEKIRKKIEVDAIKLPDDRRIFSEDYRGISSETYRSFGAFTTEMYGLKDYLCLPVFQHNKLKFIEGRLLKDLSNQPKYYRRPAQASVKDCLFPLDKISSTNHVILVEGVFDMLNMWQNGFTNTLCTFGANNFNRDKAKLLDNKGIISVDVMMDSDRAGTSAAEKIQNILDSHNIYARIIRLPAGVDPGELTKRQADALLRKV